MTMNFDLRRRQWGKETVPGTPVAATSQIAFGTLEIATGGDVVDRPRLGRGTLMRHQGNENLVKTETLWKLVNDRFNFEQFQNICSMSIVGGIAPTGVGPYVWTYTRNPLVVPAIDTYTMERRHTDGVTPNDIRFSYALASKFIVSGAVDAPVMLEVDGFARTSKANALTAALTMPAVEIAEYAGSKLYIDSTWAGIGATAIAGQLLGWKVTFNTGWYPQTTGDGRVDKDFYAHKLNGNQASLDVEIVLLAGAQYALELVASLAQTQRFVRIEVSGTAGRKVQFDMALKHVDPLLRPITDMNGQSIVSMKLVESGDDGADFFRVILTNLVAALI